MKLKNSNCDETQQLQLWWNLKTQIVIKFKTQIVMKLKSSNGDETHKLKWWLNSKTQIVMKLKNSNCEETKKPKFWQNSNCDKTKKLKCDKIQIVTKLKKNQIVTKLEWQISIYEKKKKLKSLLVRTFWHLDNQWAVLWAAFCDSCDVLVSILEEFWKDLW